MDDSMLRRFIVGAVDIVVFLDILENEQGDNTGRIIKELAEVRGITDSGSYNLEYLIKDGRIIDLPITF
jgi:pilus assembly protein CpaF